MRYLCLAYYDEKKLEALPKDEVEELVARCRRYDEELHASGQLLAVASLGPPGAAAIVRPRGGKPTITDGPFAETKEQIGAFFLLEARDLNDAIRVASKHPAAHLGEEVGWGIEVRPIEHFEQSTGG
jgi:hypothetical protein